MGGEEGSTRLLVAVAAGIVQSCAPILLARVHVTPKPQQPRHTFPLLLARGLPAGSEMGRRGVAVGGQGRGAARVWAAKIGRRGRGGGAIGLQRHSSEAPVRRPAGSRRWRQPTRPPPKRLAARVCTRGTLAAS